MLCDVKHNWVGGGDGVTNRRHGSLWLRQVDRRRGAGAAPAGAVRRRRRLPSAGQHRQDDGRQATRRRRPVSVAGSDRGVAGRALRRRRGDELLGAQAQVPRPACAATAPTSSSCISAARPRSSASGRPAGRDISCPPRCWHPSSRRSSRSNPMSAASPSMSTRTSIPSSKLRRAQPHTRTTEQENR